MDWLKNWLARIFGQTPVKKPRKKPGRKPGSVSKPRDPAATARAVETRRVNALAKQAKEQAEAEPVLSGEQHGRVIADRPLGNGADRHESV